MRRKCKGRSVTFCLSIGHPVAMKPSMKNPLRVLGLTLVSVAALCGCISHEETVYRDVTRMSVEFENETAARIFYEALSKSPAKERNSDSSTTVSIPIVFEHKRREVGGENLAFNNAVSRCDTNRDGKVTELEAKIYAENR